MKKRKIIGGVFITCMLLMLFLPVIENRMSDFFWRNKSTGDLSVYKSLFYDYEYKIEDGVVTLRKYVGNDSVVNIPNHIWIYPVKYIGTGCFEENVTIEKVKIPVNVEKIGASAFADCVNLKEVTSAQYSRLKEVGVSAFHDCINLEKFACGSNIQMISDSSFKNCAKLSDIGEQPKLQSIKAEAFAESGITDISIENLNSLGAHAFDNTPYITEYRAMTDEFVIDEFILYDCNSTAKTIVLPEDVLVVDCDFCDCPNVETIIFENVSLYNNAIYPKDREITLVFPYATKVASFDDTYNIAIIGRRDYIYGFEEAAEENNIKISFITDDAMDRLLEEYGLSLYVR